jgi:hypothetical protein
VRTHTPPKSWLNQHLTETGKTIVRLLSEAVIVGTIIGSVWAVSELKERLQNHSEDAKPKYRCTVMAHAPKPAKPKKNAVDPAGAGGRRRSSVNGCK